MENPSRRGSGSPSWIGQALLLAIAAAALPARVPGEEHSSKGQEPEGGGRRPGILFLLADQWRADAMGHAGDPNVKTPHLDRFAAEAIRFTNAVSGCPVCCPYRASLLTGQTPLTHGVFMNDVPLRDECVTIAEILAGAGYDTGYIGKWHLDGRGRSSFTPPERRQGFRYWKALECTHEYFESIYYADTDRKLRWDGYDAFAQTRDAQEFLRAHSSSEKPFLLFVSWGPPHDPYQKAPRKYLEMYDPDRIQLRPNVPAALAAASRRDLAGYYAHCTALDECVGDLRQTLRETGLEESTILVFTSDHGDLLGSHGARKKQQPYDESIRVPLLVSFPARFGRVGRKLDAPINAEDILPTLLGLCGVKCPPSVEGLDFSGYMGGGAEPSDGAAMITCPQPFGQWSRSARGREYRGLRTARYTYVRDRSGPWLFFDDLEDPFQLRNLAGKPEHAELQARLDSSLRRKLERAGDLFLPGSVYLERWGYKVDATETVPYAE